MRIMLVSQHFPPQYRGGSERSVQSLAREMAAMGDQVSIVARWPMPNPSVPVTIRERLPDDSRLYRLRGGQFNTHKFLRHHQELDHHFTAAMLAREPELVHFHHLRSLSPRFVEIAVKLGAAVVISLHDFYFACPLIHLQKTDGRLCGGPDGGRECAASCFADEPNALDRWSTRTSYFSDILSISNRVVCYSQYVAAYFEKLGVPRERLRVVPLGISPVVQSTANVAAKKGELTIAFCGSVIRHKGPHVILDALKLAKLPRVTVVMLGAMTDPAYVAEMKQSAADLAGVTLNFHGSYNWSDLTVLLADVDCVISPSLVAETFGMVPREALVRGIPVAVSRLGALPEVIREGNNGFTFDPQNPRELAAILSRLANEPDLLPRLRRGAKLTPVETTAAHAAAMRSIYEEAIDDRSAGDVNDALVLAQAHRSYKRLLTLDFQ